MGLKGASERTILVRHTLALLRKSFRSQSRQTQTNLCQVRSLAPLCMLELLQLRCAFLPYWA